MGACGHAGMQVAWPYIKKGWGSPLEPFAWRTNEHAGKSSSPTRESKCPLPKTSDSSLETKGNYANNPPVCSDHVPPTLEPESQKEKASWDGPNCFCTIPEQDWGPRQPCLGIMVWGMVARWREFSHFSFHFEPWNASHTKSLGPSGRRSSSRDSGSFGPTTLWTWHQLRIEPA